MIRALHGGSYNGNPRSVRSASSYRYRTESRNVCVGFRLCFTYSARRMLRGGAWYSDQAYVHADLHYRNRPVARSSGWGFRLGFKL